MPDRETLAETDTIARGVVCAMLAGTLKAARGELLELLEALAASPDLADLTPQEALALAIAQVQAWGAA